VVYRATDHNRTRARRAGNLPRAKIMGKGRGERRLSRSEKVISTPYITSHRSLERKIGISKTGYLGGNVYSSLEYKEHTDTFSTSLVYIFFTFLIDKEF
jgi:hypothetical protein